MGYRSGHSGLRRADWEYGIGCIPCSFPSSTTFQRVTWATQERQTCGGVSPPCGPARAFQRVSEIQAGTARSDPSLVIIAFGNGFFTRNRESNNNPTVRARLLSSNVTCLLSQARRIRLSLRPGRAND